MNGEAELEQILRRVDRAIYPSEFEWEAESGPNQEILALCQEADRVANGLREALRENPGQRGNILKAGFRWIRDKTEAWRGRLGTLRVEDLDRLNGCISRVSSALGQDPERLRTLRQSIGRRGRQLGGRFP